MEGTVLRRHRDGPVRDDGNADQAPDRMIAETRAAARQRSSPPDPCSEEVETSGWTR